MERYNIDICAIQETKITEEETANINNYKLIFFKQSKSYHYGLNIVIKYTDIRKSTIE